MLVRHMKNQRGIALVTALLLTLISLAVIMTVLYFINSGTAVSAANKRYRSAVEAAHGGGDLSRQLIADLYSPSFANISGAKIGLEAAYSAIGLTVPVSSVCLDQKLHNATSQWSACSPESKTTDPRVSPDITFKLQGVPSQPGFNVFTKIVNSTPGNSSESVISGLTGASGVTDSKSGISPQHIPAMYSVEIEGERETNPQEKANVSILYAY